MKDLMGRRPHDRSPALGLNAQPVGGTCHTTTTSSTFKVTDSGVLKQIIRERGFCVVANFLCFLRFNWRM